ncbi:RNA-directed DNA polymerase from mobile element jockey [Trichonephila clavipes]|nr:RNA-directed DNA polymerase from mobile element jockey [Trichonephila clavipes]
MAPMIIFGDFNLHHPMWGSDHISRYSDEFVEWITDSNLVLLNTTVPTYRSSADATSLLDLTVCSSSISGYCNSYVLDCSFESDHSPIITELSLLNSNKRIFKKVNWQAVMTQTHFIFNNPEVDSENLSDKISHVIANNIREIKVSNRSFPPWWNKTLAICQALDDLVESNVSLLVLSDSLSVLSALQNFSIKSNKVIHRLANKIYMLSNCVDQLILLWTPGHSKIVWNEQADNLARSVTESNVYIDWIASDDIHKNIYRNRIRKINETFYSSKYFEKLGNIPTIDIISKWTENRREEILSTRIFSKMIITPGLLHRFNLQDNAMCITCKRINDLDHIILNCIRYTTHRNNLWSILRIDPHTTITFRDVLERAMNNKSTFRVFFKGNEIFQYLLIY